MALNQEEENVEQKVVQNKQERDQKKIQDEEAHTMHNPFCRMPWLGELTKPTRNEIFLIYLQ